MGFYDKVEQFSNLYAMQMGLGGSYGHTFKPINIAELLHFDAVVVCDGDKGGSKGAVH